MSITYQIILICDRIPAGPFQRCCVQDEWVRKPAFLNAFFLQMWTHDHI